jgi:conjugative transfer pilus assembly protein TraH
MFRVFSTAIVIGLLLFSTAIPPAYAGSGWVDDWLASKTSNGGQYLEGQQRGYFSGGSFSARWKSNTDSNLLTVQPPSINTGCGGIDVFEGAFAFLDLDYLVEKLQGMLMNAAAIAFDMALNELCTPCSTAIKSFEAITDRLNSIQMDECSMAKTSVTYVKDYFSSPEAKQSEKGEKTVASEVATGADEPFWSGVVSNIMQDQGGVPTPEQNTRSVSGCSAQLQSIFLNDLGDGSHMLFTDIAKDEFGMDEEYVNLIRGMLGDIEISDKDDAFKVIPILPCLENDMSNINALISGEAQAMDNSGTCYAVTDTNGDLVQHYFDKLLGIADAYKNKTALTTEQEAFINTSPLSIGTIIRTAVGTRQENAIIANIAVLSAKAQALAMFSDLIARAQRVLERINQAAAESEPLAAGADVNTCDPSIFSNLAERADQIKTDAFKLMDFMRESYRKDAAEVAYINSIIESNIRVKDLLHKRTSEIFGAGVSRRM